MKGISVNDDLAADLDRLTSNRGDGFNERTTARGAKATRKILAFKRQLDRRAIGRADEYAIPSPNLAVQGDNLPEAKIVGRREIDPVATKSEGAGDTTDQHCAGAKNNEGIAAGAQRVIPGFWVWACAFASACACFFSCAPT